MNPSPDALRRGDILGFALVALLLLSATAWTRDLFDADEGRYAAVAVEMSRTGDWVVPRLDGMPFMDKPPLVYHVQAVLFSVFGESALMARSPTLLAGALWALFIFLFAHAWGGGRRTAWLSGLLAVTSAGGVIGARVGPQMDMPLAAAVAGVLYAGWRGMLHGGRPARLGLGLAVGCGLLIKGPLVVAVPALVAVGWAFAGVPVRALLGMFFSPWAWAVALLVAAPWYILVEQAQPGWIAHFINYEHFGRFNQGDHRAFHPFWFYVPIALLYMAPWSAMAWGGLRALRLRGRLPRLLAAPVACSPWSPLPWTTAMAARVSVGGRRVPVARLAWLWFVLAFVLYSLATRKLLNYLLPAAAPLFLLLGVRFERALSPSAWQARLLPLVLGLGTVIVGLLVWAGLLLPFATGRLPASLETVRFAPAGPWLVAAGLILGGGALLWPRLSRAGQRAGVLLAAAAIAWGCVEVGFARIDAVGSARTLAQALKAQAGRADIVVALKRYPQGLGFYGAPRIWMAGGDPDDWAQREIVNPYAREIWEQQALRSDGLPDWTRHEGGLLTSAQFERLWGGAAKVLLICRWGEVGPLRAQVLSGPYGGGGRTDLYLVTNHALGN